MKPLCALRQSLCGWRRNSNLISNIIVSLCSLWRHAPQCDTAVFSLRFDRTSRLVISNVRRHIRPCFAGAFRKVPLERRAAAFYRSVPVAEVRAVGSVV